MSQINGELLSLYRAERLRERETCIATLVQVVNEIADQCVGETLDFQDVIELMIERIRSQP